jgi:hypothetical protein
MKISQLIKKNGKDCPNFAPASYSIYSEVFTRKLCTRAHNSIFQGT